MLNLRGLDADDWQLWRDVRLKALREAPYAFSAKLEEWQGERDTEQRWRNRLTDVPLNVIAELNGNAAGMVSATAPDADGTVELISMWVAPSARGRGVGDAMVASVLQWAQMQRADSVVLAVFENNERAADLYRRHGFVDRGRIETGVEKDPPQRRMSYVFDR
jgi:ribosomal protein S18 acetylase RimI-like enzyme